MCCRPARKGWHWRHEAERHGQVGTDRPGSPLRGRGRRPPIRRCGPVVHRQAELRLPTHPNSGSPSVASTDMTASARRWPRLPAWPAPNTGSWARCMPKAPRPITRWAASPASLIVEPFGRGGDGPRLASALRRRILLSPSGWRIHGRALTINAIETLPIRRLREHPPRTRSGSDPASDGRAGPADPSAVSTAPQPRKTNRPRSISDTP